MRRQQLVGLDLPAAVGQRMQEAVTVRDGFEREIRAPPLRDGARVLDGAAQPIALGAQLRGAVVAESQRDETEAQPDDRQRDQHLDERESPANAQQLPRYCHEPISASRPSPPGFPSAPSESTSISP